MSEEIQEVKQDELTVLKKRADQMGIKYHPSIGLDSLKEKIADKKEPKKEVVKPKEVEAKVETPAQRNARLRKEASKLVRVRITCMNPAKKEWEGEIFTVSNSFIGTFKKFVQFNAEDGWHVPQVILNVIKERKCQVFYTEKGPRGNKIRKGKLIKEFGVELLDPLSPEELADLARKQAMANNLD